MVPGHATERPFDKSIFLLVEACYCMMEHGIAPMQPVKPSLKMQPRASSAPHQLRVSVKVHPFQFVYEDIEPPISLYDLFGDL
jgi:hypothetical protein